MTVIDPAVAVMGMAIRSSASLVAARDSTLNASIVIPRPEQYARIGCAANKYTDEPAPWLVIHLVYPNGDRPARNAHWLLSRDIRGGTQVIERGCRHGRYRPLLCTSRARRHYRHQRLARTRVRGLLGRARDFQTRHHRDRPASTAELVRASTCSLVALLVAARAMYAQEVHGTVIDAGSRAPVTGAVVQLLDSAKTVIARNLSNEREATIASRLLDPLFVQRRSSSCGSGSVR